MKYITKEEAMNRKKYVPSPLDNKNLMDDWITDYLPDCYAGFATRDDASFTEILTFIGGEPWRIVYHGNHLAFFAIVLPCDMTKIRSAVEDLIGKTEGLCAVWYECDSHCSFHFYWELDE